MKRTTEKEQRQPALRIIPLGGLEQIGMNITAFEFGDSIIVVDCGLAFPEDDMFGIDLVIPDTTYLENNIDKVKGFVITHGHEDHIGALPYVLQKINVPVFATRLTMGIIENKLKERGMMETTQRKVISFGSSVSLGCFRVEFIKTNHSIVDAAALAIKDHRPALPGAQRHEDHHRDLCFQRGQGAADHQFRLQAWQEGSRGRPQHGQHHRDGFRTGMP